jgi:hypothetical protein
VKHKDNFTLFILLLHLLIPYLFSYLTAKAMKDLTNHTIDQVGVPVKPDLYLAGVWF